MRFALFLRLLLFVTKQNKIKISFDFALRLYLLFFALAGLTLDYI